VYIKGIDVYKNYDSIRNHIGYVPQRDIIHMELTVYQALDYAAKLRMPMDTTTAERHKRIMEVLDDLDLTQRKDLQVSRLSGAASKSASRLESSCSPNPACSSWIATSGLDPGTETTFMQLMRRLADPGPYHCAGHKTRATERHAGDRVVFLARGGYLAWFGPPMKRCVI